MASHAGLKLHGSKSSERLSNAGSTQGTLFGSSRRATTTQLSVHHDRKNRADIL